jgi:pimeloyl-ACP methyl ester carboxylesterase
VFGDDALAGLRMPVLAILGERDALLDAPATARRLTAAVPGADVRLLPGAGHYLPHQAPALAAFLTGSPAGLPSAEEATPS